ncbi:hypothetical protein SAY86_015170 [Trapa natans]|uniref:Protein downstream neighbor of Son n=1 Tax=Trapa natans TaxID=22666 RepID=A0AAN7QK56_TRANT|nr:hypothetical protein SAY86_015170 [Trapa natans]
MTMATDPGSLPQDSFHPGGGGHGGGNLKVVSRVRRKTPSELRGEQLKRANASELVNESPVSFVPAINHINATDSFKKVGTVKSPRYIDTRVDEVYPAKKSRLSMLSVKANAKESYSVEKANTLKNMPAFSWLADSRNQQFPRNQESSFLPTENSEDSAAQRACVQSKFRSVAEISSAGENLTSLSEIDMNKALTGLATQKLFSSVFAVGSSETSRSPMLAGELLHHDITPCKRIPIDLTMKTIVRVVSSSPLSGIYRSIMQQISGPLHMSTSSFHKDQGFNSGLGTASSLSKFSTKALHSWIYPQSTLPPSLVSVMMSSEAATVELDFLRKRELGWEESFRSLYYMLRKRLCHIFYVCTSQFVVVFTGIDKPEKTRYTCNAYISRSTRGLRSLLRVNDVCFSMPLCSSKVEQTATEDLVELLEIEKYNLGQARRPTSLTDIDNSPQSVLALTGHKNIHRLYDVLLNYRTSMTFLNGEDVPTLYSPVPFCNSALAIPEVRCIQTKVADYASDSSRMLSKPGASTTSVGNILEIKDPYLPPWIVCDLCEIISSQGDFEASFMTEGSSIGLNAALEALHDVRDGPVLGITSAELYPTLCSGSLKSLKFHNGSYTPSISPA